MRPCRLHRCARARGDPTPIFDQRIDTDWVDAPQHNGQWLLVDLGSRGDVGGVAQALEEHAGDFPRHLAVDLSDDGEAWTEVWNGNTAAATFLAALREPRTGWLRIAFPARPARYVRIRQTADVSIGWRVRNSQSTVRPTDVAADASHAATDPGDAATTPVM